jgi:hypothetical protein
MSWVVNCKFHRSLIRVLLIAERSHLWTSGARTLLDEKTTYV